VILTELVQDAGGTVAKIFNVLAARGILDLVSLENFLGFFGLSFRDGLGKNMLEEILHTPGDENTDFILEVSVELVLSDEGVDAGFDAGHFGRLKAVFLFVNLFRGTLRIFDFVKSLVLVIFGLGDFMVP